MKFKEDKVFNYQLNKESASIFGSDIAEIEWNITEDGEVIITQFINNEYHTPIMDYDHFYNHNIELYTQIIEYIEKWYSRGNYNLIDNK